MKLINSRSELSTYLTDVIDTSDNNIKILDTEKLQNETIDTLVYSATFTTDTKLQNHLRTLIFGLASTLNIHPSSINNLYFAIGRGEVKGFTVPAINVRMMTYDTARVVFQLIKEHSIGPIIFEIARSEMQYTFQKPAEYTTSILAAAIKEGYSGPVFLQGDHFQFSPAKFKEDPTAETDRLKDLIKESVMAGFFNIDIDASTLVDLSKKDLDEQQKNNYEKSAELTEYIRSIQPSDMTVSIGGEIGHIGGVNSTTSDFAAFMEGYLKKVDTSKMVGMSKVSVQTGTSHGGMPLPGGGVAEVKLDFNVLKDIGALAKEKYNIGGAVQHGASTLPNELFFNFPIYHTLEIHLATGFQNIVYDTMPPELREKMYQWTRENTKSEWKATDTEEQNIYKTRKKAIGPFKKELWSLSDADKAPIREKLAQQFGFLFKQLNVANTKQFAEKYALYSKTNTMSKAADSKKPEVKVDDLSD